MTTYDVDPEILSGFIDESREGLEPLDTLFIEFEKNPDNLDLINTIFRPVHSIKGSAAFFGLLKIKTLAHKMEDVLDKVRHNQLRVTAGMIQTLLSGLDLLKSMFARVHSGNTEIEDEALFQKIIKSLESACVQDESVIELETQGNVVEILGELIFKLEEIRNLLPDNAAHHIDQAQGIISKVIPGLIASPKTSGEKTPEAAPKDEKNPIEIILKILRTPIEDVLDDTLSDRVGKELVTLLETADSEETEFIIKSTLEEYEAFMRQIGFDDLLREMVIEKMTVLKEMGKFKKGPPKETPLPSPKASPHPPQELKTERRKGEDRRDGDDRRNAHGVPGEKTMRVSEKNMDAFLSYVSELVVIEEMFTYLQKKLLSSTGKEMASEFKRVIETFGDLSANLRQSILAIRKVPARIILQKAPRIIHDIAKESGKKVNIQIEGGDIPIDKSYVEILDAPFVHMVRNAVDHGIEPENERIASGKAPAGTIRIILRETKKDIELVISDDGKGLNYKAISEKAFEMGIIAKDQALDDEAVKDILFMAGVSTAKEVTDVSGRGVGMDVVKKNIEATGGKIRIESTEGQGSTFIVSLPRTISTQIMEGFLLRAGKDIYVMPMELIGESFALEQSHLNTVSGENEMILRRGELLPVIRLSKELERDFRKTGSSQEDLKTDRKESVCISVTVNGKRHALLVNEIIGLQKVVVRNVSGITVHEKLFDGAAMLGDGRVAMILGTDGLRRLIL